MLAQFLKPVSFKESAELNTSAVTYLLVSLTCSLSGPDYCFALFPHLFRSPINDPFWKGTGSLAELRIIITLSGILAHFAG